MRRARVVLLLTTLATVPVLAAGAVALALATGPSSDRRDEYGVRLARLVDDVAVAVPVTLPGPDAQRSRVVFVRHDGTLAAFLAVDPRYGCALSVAGEPDYERLLGIRGDPGRFFYDNCGGAVYGADGTCTGGPCIRDLDRFPVRVRDSQAVIDITDRELGPTRNR